MMSLDGKNQFSMEHLYLPKPGNSKPSISIMLPSPMKFNLNSKRDDILIALNVVFVHFGVF